MNDWIRCEVAMPSQGQTVLVVASGQVKSAEYWIHEEGVHDADTGFCDINQDDVYPVTHWMPMPEPPK